MSTIAEQVCLDHQALAHDYEQILDSKDIDTATRWQNQFVWTLVRHLVAKEQVLFPAFELHLQARGKFIIDKDRSQYHDIKENLMKFQSLTPTTQEFFSVIQALMNDLGNHFTEEELADLPALEKNISREQSRKLAEQFKSRKTFAPSRCHVVAPDMPALNALAGLMAAPLDFFGDLLRKFPQVDQEREST